MLDFASLLFPVATEFGTQSRPRSQTNPAALKIHGALGDETLATSYPALDVEGDQSKRLSATMPFWREGCHRIAVRPNRQTPGLLITLDREPFAPSQPAQTRPGSVRARMQRLPPS